MTLGEFRNLTKSIDDNAELYFDTTELPLWYLSHRKRNGLPDLVLLHDKDSMNTNDLQEEVRSACRYLEGVQRSDIWKITD